MQHRWHARDIGVTAVLVLMATTQLLGFLHGTLILQAIFLHSPLSTLPAIPLL